MEPALVLKTATVLLALGALGGLVMAGMRFAGQPHPPAWLAMLHGSVAAAALTLLIYAAATVGLPALALGALILFLIAGAGGAVLNLRYHWKMLALPKWLIVVHAGVAGLGFALLVIAAWAASGA
ncbi:hypothetical protein [Paraburkholderia terricola]|uniref:hypothetical protein n=1 Tax=Paraburkholderia terricola TaxID=169427 RepID=UPI00285C8931|nr:hypothetical protein [Paraburkholderia terricola]MDR6479569.1 uncharacterized membrane protein YjjP (DUF1212 family) [Paraburkholderia terricola]